MVILFKSREEKNNLKPGGILFGNAQLKQSSGVGLRGERHAVKDPAQQHTAHRKRKTLLSAKLAALRSAPFPTASLTCHVAAAAQAQTSLNLLLREQRFEDLNNRFVITSLFANFSPASMSSCPMFMAKLKFCIGVTLGLTLIAFAV